MLPEKAKTINKKLNKINDFFNILTSHFNRSVYQNLKPRLTMIDFNPTYFIDILPMPKGRDFTAIVGQIICWVLSAITRR